MGGNLPAWWTANFPELIAKREAMPGVERLQTSYVKYRRFQEAQVAGGNGWDLAISRRNYEQVARLEQQFFMQDDHPLFNPLAPDNITMRIIEAPAEFAVPVKQDRRLSPSFRVRVDVRYRSRVGIPVTVKAHLITQQDKDNVLAWLPEDMNPYASADDKAQRSMTELKGTTCITHHFEGNQGGPGGNAPAPIMNTGMGNLGGGMPRLGLQGGLGGGQRLLDTSPAALAAMKLKGLMTWPQQQHQGLDGSDQGKLVEQLLMQQQQHQQQMSHNDLLLSNGLSNGLDAGLLHHSQLGGGGGGYGAPNGMQQLMQQLNQNQLGNMLLLNGGGQQGLGLMQHQHQQDDHAAQAAAMQQAQQEAQLAASIATGMAAAAAAQQQQQHLGVGGGGGESHTLSHEYEFTNLELLKPTRMNKVYIVFSCTILDMDTLYCVYNVPTIGICRAEQREKACQKLCVPLSVLAVEGLPTPKAEAIDLGRMGMGGTPLGMGAMGIPPQSMQAAQAAAAATQQRKRTDRLMGGESDDSQGYAPITTAPAMRGPTSGDLALGLPGGGEVEMGGAAGGGGPALSRAALQDWILEEYEGTGLTRKLTRLDLAALLSQAGFPTEGGAHTDHATVSQVQWDEFCGQFRGLLRLLRQIAAVWNLEDPCVVCGFDMDRQGTVQALTSEPAGTFLCRFSMSQPGCLVLSCKTVAGHPKAEADDLIHAIINIDDLHERRVDTWIRDFAGATHVLDVYRHRRVDKRKVFTSNYTRLKGLDSAPPPFPEGATDYAMAGLEATEVA